MGAVPKSRVGPRRKRLRRTHDHAAMPALVRCETCRSLKVAHHVCPECGTYRGVEIVATGSKE
jgi:large subunit ribosomal protein L32